MGQTAHTKSPRRSTGASSECESIHTLCYNASMTDDDYYDGEWGLPKDDDEQYLRAVPNLPELLNIYNDVLGWNQADLARAVRRDEAWVSRIMTGQRPHDQSLQLFVDAYRAAGLTNVTLEHLKAARDVSQLTYDNPWDIPPHWLALIRKVMSLPIDIQEMAYQQWSIDLQMKTAILNRSEDDDDLDSDPSTA